MFNIYSKNEHNTVSFNKVYLKLCALALVDVKFLVEAIRNTLGSMSQNSSNKSSDIPYIFIFAKFNELSMH